MTENRSDIAPTEVSADAERETSEQATTEATASDAPQTPDVAPPMEGPRSGDGDAQPSSPDIAPPVEQPAAAVPPAGTESSSAEVAPAAEAAERAKDEDRSAEAPQAGAAQTDEGSAQAASEPGAQTGETPGSQTGEGSAQAASAPGARTGEGAAQPESAPADPAASGDVDPEQAPLSGDSGTEQRERRMPPPGAGPVIIGRAEDVTPPPVPPVKQSLKDVERQQRPRRRRLNATQRHRNVFFARLNEFRRQAQQSGDAEPGPTEHEAAIEAAEAAAATEQAQATASEQPDAAAAQAPAGDAAEAGAPEGDAVAEQAPAGGVPEDQQPAAGGEQEQGGQRRRSAPPPVDRPRLVSAIERAGGSEVVLEALQPKRDEQDQPLKWATVCADACKGLKPSDPVFTAWVRLAATPVSAIKNELGVSDRRSERGRGRGGAGRGRGAEGRGPRREDRGPRVSREDLNRLGRGGSVGATVRFIGFDDGDTEKQEREERRKAEREAKREAERERLARLGY